MGNNIVCYPRAHSGGSKGNTRRMNAMMQALVQQQAMNHDVFLFLNNQCMKYIFFNFCTGNLQTYRAK